MLAGKFNVVKVESVPLNSIFLACGASAVRAGDHRRS